MSPAYPTSWGNTAYTRVSQGSTFSANNYYISWMISITKIEWIILSYIFALYFSSFHCTHFWLVWWTISRLRFDYVHAASSFTIIIYEINLVVKKCKYLAQRHWLLCWSVCQDSRSRIVCFVRYNWQEARRAARRVPLRLRTDRREQSHQPGRPKHHLHQAARPTVPRRSQQAEQVWNHI